MLAWETTYQYNDGQGRIKSKDKGPNEIGRITKQGKNLTTQRRENRDTTAAPARLGGRGRQPAPTPAGHAQRGRSGRAHPYRARAARSERWNQAGRTVRTPGGHPTRRAPGDPSVGTGAAAVEDDEQRAAAGNPAKRTRMSNRGGGER